MTVEAHVTFAGESAPSVGRERIRLLEEVGRAGSISGGARAVGLTYKAAWDAVDALNNLFGRRPARRRRRSHRRRPAGDRHLSAQRCGYSNAAQAFFAKNGHHNGRRLRAAVVMASDRSAGFAE